MTRFRNSASSLIRLGVLGPLLVGVGLLLVWGTIAGAQGFGPDPFHPYNSDYSQYVWPISPTNDYGYNRQAFRGQRGANQFQNYLDSLQGAGTNPSTRGGAGTPYYRANRKYDRDFGRVYEPNKNADKDFDQYREKSTDLYFKYRREKDPRQRALLFRQYNQLRTESDRALSPSRANAGPANRFLGADEENAGRTERGISRKRNLQAEPPPLSSDRSGDRSRGRTGRGGSASSLGSAPSPLGGSGSSAGMGHAPSPSEVLERALRSDRERSRVTPRRRSVRALAPGPPPPTP
jgi:hypothetical protein